MLDERSERNLIGVHPELVHLCYMMDQAEHKFIITSPPRTKAQQEALYAQGREPVQVVHALRKRALLPKISDAEAKIVVTWTLKSKHIIQNSGFAEAFDFAPRPVNWNNTTAFDLMGKDFKDMAKSLGIRVVWGGDWKKPDRPHIELA